MIGALQSKQVVKGNLSIRFSNNTFTFNYRGTDIMQWNMSFDTISEVFCGSHETSPSTRNQRKMAREAIEEFKERLL